MRRFGRIRRAGRRIELQAFPVFLTPFDQTALKIGLLLGHIVQIDVFPQNPVDKKPVRKIVSLVEVNRSHHCFERIPVQVFLGKAVAALGDHVPVEPDLDRQPVQRRTPDDPRTQPGQKPLIRLGKLDEQEIRYDRLDHRVAEEFEPFVIDRGPVVQKQGS